MARSGFPLRRSLFIIIGLSTTIFLIKLIPSQSSIALPSFPEYLKLKYDHSDFVNRLGFGNSVELDEGSEAVGSSSNGGKWNDWIWSSFSSSNQDLSTTTGLFEDSPLFSPPSHRPSVDFPIRGSLPSHSSPPDSFYPSLSSSSSYRSHIHHLTSSPTLTSHSRTLTFSHIYVLSLPTRIDRRERMTKLAEALGLDIVFVDAYNGNDMEDGLMGWIAERVREVRDAKAPVLRKMLGGREPGGMGIESIWLTREGEKVFMDPDGDKSLVSGPGRFAKAFPEDDRWGTDPTTGKPYTWVEYLENHPDPLSLKPSDPNINITSLLWDPIETNDFRQIRPGVIATWYSQTRVWKLMEHYGDESALVMEDDVDFEWELERIWAGIEESLRDGIRWEKELKEEGKGEKDKLLGRDWEIVLLGSCWGRELTYPATFHPLLHPSAEPRCLHGYALSKPGYNTLLSIYSDPLIAYQTAVDTLMPNLIKKKLVKSYSVEPSLIIQSKDLSSDIQSGIGSPWRGVLMDSTLERVEMSEGREVWKSYDPKDDPSTKIRLPVWAENGRSKGKPKSGPNRLPKEEFDDAPLTAPLKPPSSPPDDAPLTSPDPDRSAARLAALNRPIGPLNDVGVELNINLNDVKETVDKSLRKASGGKKLPGPAVLGSMDFGGAVPVTEEEAKKGGKGKGKGTGKGIAVGDLFPPPPRT